MTAAAASSSLRWCIRSVRMTARTRAGCLVTVDEHGRADQSGRRREPSGDGRDSLCGKVAKYLDLSYAPAADSLSAETKSRRWPRAAGAGAGDEAFERVSWDEALGAIAARLKRVADEFGPESILPYSYAGTIGRAGIRIDGPAILSHRWGRATGPDDLFGGGRRGVEAGLLERSWARRRRISG